MAMHQIRPTPASPASASSVRCQSAARSGCGAQGAQAEPVDQHPVLLDGAHAPPAGVVEPPPEERRIHRLGGEPVDPPLALGEVRRARRDVPGVDHQRRAAEPCGELLDRVTRPLTPGRTHPGAAPRSSSPTAEPRRGSRSRRSAGGPRAGSTTSRARRRAPARRRSRSASTASATLAPMVRPASVRYQYAAPLSVQYDRCDVIGLASRRRRGRPARQLAAPAVQQRRGRLALEDPEGGREAGGDVVEVAVPSPPQRAVDDGRCTCSCGWSSGASHDVPPADPAEQHPERRRRLQVRAPGGSRSRAPGRRPPAGRTGSYAKPR